MYYLSILNFSAAQIFIKCKNISRSYRLKLVSIFPLVLSPRLKFLRKTKRFADNLSRVKNLFENKFDGQTVLILLAGTLAVIRIYYLYNVLRDNQSRIFMLFNCKQAEESRKSVLWKKHSIR